MIDLPPDAIETYEGLRSQALGGGGCRSGLAAIVHHGLIGGLTQVLAGAGQSVSASPNHPISSDATPATVATDPDLVRVLANMVLRVHTEVSHVY